MVAMLRGEHSHWYLSHVHYDARSLIQVNLVAEFRLH